jgi:hypothetical protein
LRIPSVRAFEQRRTGFPAGASFVDPKARHHNPVPCDQYRDDLGRRDIRVELEISPWSAVELAGDLGPFVDRAEAIAHPIKVAIQARRSSGFRAFRRPRQRSGPTPRQGVVISDMGQFVTNDANDFITA